MKRAPRKKPCECGHGKAIHNVSAADRREGKGCNHPGCTCRGYTPSLTQPAIFLPMVARKTR
jgi:hypothetical protein